MSHETISLENEDLITSNLGYVGIINHLDLLSSLTIPDNWDKVSLQQKHIDFKSVSRPTLFLGG